MTTNKFSHTIIATKYPSLFSFLKLIDKYLFFRLLALLKQKYLHFISNSELKKYEFDYSIFYSHRKCGVHIILQVKGLCRKVAVALMLNLNHRQSVW